MTVEPFISSFSDLYVDGWCAMGPAWVSRLPLLDSHNNVFAELTYHGALEAAKAFGARLPTQAELNTINVLGLRLNPVELPTVDMIAGMTSAQINAYRNANMMGLEWAKLHTAKVRSQLDARPWNGWGLVANAGKHWLTGAPAGRAYLMGWFEEGRWTQQGCQPHSGEGPHSDEHHDYATTTLLIRDEAP